MVGLVEMRIVGGDEAEAAAFGQKKVGDGGTIGAVAAGGAAVVVDLDRVGGGDRAGVGQREAGPLRVRDGDEGTGSDGAGGDFGPRFLTRDGQEAGRVRGREIGRQANGEDVPKFAVRHGAGVQFSAEDGGEAVAAEGFGVDDRIAVGADEMVGQGKEIIAFGTVAAADLFGCQHPVGAGGVGVDVAAPEPAGVGEGDVGGHGCPLISTCRSATLVPVPPVIRRSSEAARQGLLSFCDRRATGSTPLARIRARLP